MVAQCSYISHILDMTLVCTKLLQPIKPLCKEIKKQNCNKFGFGVVINRSFSFNNVAGSATAPSCSPQQSCC